MRNYIWTSLKGRDDGSMLKVEGDDYSQLKERKTQGCEDVKALGERHTDGETMATGR